MTDDCTVPDQYSYMNKQFQVHRNKCHLCFKSTGRFILDCYCILCQQCFAKRDRANQLCPICMQKSKHNFIDVQDRSNVSKMSYLFSNLEFSFNRCIEAYKFQASIDAKYCKFLENQLNRYKDAIAEIVMFNPQFEGYFQAKLASKPRPHRSSSECLPNPLSQHQQNHRATEKQSNPTHTPRSHSNSNVVMQHEKLVDPQRLAKGDRNYSAKVNYKMPNINYSTAMRSSKRPRQRDEEQDNGYFHNKR